MNQNLHLQEIPKVMEQTCQQLQLDSLIHNVSLFQYASEEALGMASKARIAANKICWSSGCYNSIILTAMDRAIYDRVHVISLFVGATAHAPQYDHDLINCHRGI
jgi:hypothetical protein